MHGVASGLVLPKDFKSLVLLLVLLVLPRVQCQRPVGVPSRDLGLPGANLENKY